MDIYNDSRWNQYRKQAKLFHHFYKLEEAKGRTSKLINTITKVIWVLSFYFQAWPQAKYLIPGILYCF
jgi:hypothetical protein